MNPDTTTHDKPSEPSRLYAAYLAAARRDPRQHPFGYLAVDPEIGARAPFLWFASASALFSCLIDLETDLLHLDDPDAARIKAALQRAIGAARDVARVSRESLSAAFDGWNAIVWIGTFNDLCSRGGELPTNLRAAYRSGTGSASNTGPIDDTELLGFIRFLTELSNVPEP